MTTIEWTDKSINPIRAYDRRTGAVGHYCELLSPGCAHCYASNLQKRFSMRPFPGKGRNETLPILNDRGRVIVNDKTEVGLEQHALDSVLNRKKPTLWFWCDMSDMFGSWVPDVWIDKCFAVMNATTNRLPIPSNPAHVQPWHTHQVLTKRIDRACTYLKSRLASNYTKVGKHPIFEAGRGEGGSLRGRGDKGVDLMNAGACLSWPLSNVWLGTSCENQQQANERVTWLIAAPAAVRFLSLEPLLGPIDLRQCLTPAGDRDVLFVGEEGGAEYVGSPRGFIDWVIVGGESGPGARPCQIEWIRDIVKQCKAARVPVFVKQLGNRSTMWDAAADGLGGVTGGGGNLDYHTNHPKGGDPAEWPEDLRVREFPNVRN